MSSQFFNRGTNEIVLKNDLTCIGQVGSFKKRLMICSIAASQFCSATGFDESNIGSENWLKSTSEFWFVRLASRTRVAIEFIMSTEQGLEI